MGYENAFQFHKGTIKTVIRTRFNVCCVNFNSIKVRLKLDSTPSVPTLFSVFQFHKGTIKTTSCLAETLIEDLFQFHKGTIKTTILEVTSTTSI